MIIVYMNSHRKYSHILNLKVWSETAAKVDQGSIIERIVRDSFLYREHVREGVKLMWFKKAWSFPESQFDLGDIVIDSPLPQDDQLLHYVETTVREIEANLRKDKLLFVHQRILFHMMKPLALNVRLNHPLEIIV